MIDFEKIIERVQEKRKDYETYRFDRTKDNALKSFFDLAQEYATLEDICQVASAVIREYFSFKSRIYIRSEDPAKFGLICNSDEGLVKSDVGQVADYLTGMAEEFTRDSSKFYPIRGNVLKMEKLPFPAADEVLGFLEVYPADDLSEEDEFYLQKYANRLGFSLHNTMLGLKNVKHIAFINSLIVDVEHNVIQPNIFFKVYLKRFKMHINKNEEVKRHLEELLKKREEISRQEGLLVMDEMEEINHALMEEFNNIEKHYLNTSLFMESLFRRDHFEKGQFVLKKRKCNFNREVVQPQLERYRARFKARDIEVNTEYSGVPDEDITAFLDVGLISQVFANLFSNAVKYTQEVNSQKYVSYGFNLEKGFFSPMSDGIKFNVFTTGPNLSSKEAQKLYEEEFRGANARWEMGTGHGLSFVREVITIHGGVVGYEPTEMGNNFYFVLPLEKD